MVKVDQSRVIIVERKHLRGDISNLKRFISWKPQISISEELKL